MQALAALMSPFGWYGSCVAIYNGAGLAPRLSQAILVVTNAQLYFTFCGPIPPEKPHCHMTFSLATSFVKIHNTTRKGMVLPKQSLYTNVKKKVYVTFHQKFELRDFFFFFLQKKPLSLYPSQI